MMDQLISFETAKLAKEKGFNVCCNFMYDRHNEIQHTPSIKQVMAEGGLKALKTPVQIFAPTQSLLQKWLREEHKIRVFPEHSIQGIYKFSIRKWNYDNDKGEWERIGSVLSFATYEEALEQGLLEALETLKNK